MFTSPFLCRSGHAFVLTFVILRSHVRSAELSRSIVVLKGVCHFYGEISWDLLRDIFVGEAIRRFFPEVVIANRDMGSTAVLRVAAVETQARPKGRRKVHGLLQQEI